MTSSDSRSPSSPLLELVSGGFTQVLLLEGDGSVWAMGADTRGQLGIGSIGKSAYSSVPVKVDLPGKTKQVGSGTAISFAVAANDRSAYAWGDNTLGQLGIGKKSVRYATTPGSIDFHLPRGVRIVSMADGLFCSLALLSDGRVMAWGDNQYGQCGLNPRTAGAKIYKPTLVPHLHSVKQIASGDDYSLFLTSGGEVWACGRDTFGQLGPHFRDPTTATFSSALVRVTGLPPVAKIVCGGNNGIALDRQGRVWEWGRNAFGELGNGAVEGRDVPPNPVPHEVAGLPKIVSLSSEGPTVLAADRQGDVYAWGYNTWGAVGDGSTSDTGTPTLIMRLPTAPDAFGPSVQVAAAHRSSYAFNAVTGQFYAWGENNYGQIGIPANTTANTIPVNITAEIAGAEPVVCFVTGTRIRTTHGDVAVEDLKVGDMAITASGGPRPIRWLGHRTLDCGRPQAMPVRISANAFGPARPARDLLVSPGHAICIDLLGEVLVPASSLLNGMTIVAIDLARVTYWHVELDSHDILLAENLPAESYIDMDNRGFFVDSRVVRLGAGPDASLRTHVDFCRPFHEASPIVDAIRTRLAARATQAVKAAARVRHLKR